MGQEFAIAFDIAVIAIPAVFAFVGLKRGFAKVVLGLVATLVAFAVAMALSGPIANAIYSNGIKKSVEEQLDKMADGKLSEMTFSVISEIDFDKVKINGVYANDIQLDYAGTRKVAVDLVQLDLSETGLTKADLVKIGIVDESDLSKLNAKSAEFSMDDIEKYGLGQLAVAQYIAVSIIKLPIMSGFDSLAEKVGKYLPGVIGSSSTDGKGVSALRTITVKMLDTRVDFKEAVMNGVVKPSCMLIIRTAAFAIIFLILSIVLRIITSAAKLVNKIPVIGKVNSLLGFILGLAEGIIAVFVVCLGIRLAVSLAGTNSILFNQTVIDSTFLFKWFYGFEFLNFIK